MRFVGSADVTTKIAHMAGAAAPGHISAHHVMQWVMGNTVEATQHGVLEWVAQVRTGVGDLLALRSAACLAAMPATCVSVTVSPVAHELCSSCTWCPGGCC